MSARSLRPGHRQRQVRMGRTRERRDRRLNPSAEATSASGRKQTSPPSPQRRGDRRSTSPPVPCPLLGGSGHHVDVTFKIYAARDRVAEPELLPTAALALLSAKPNLMSTIEVARLPKSVF